ncbi:MAG: VTT domain-containing protein [Planctomycetes bacterium]|nr:VTT domain-containing protein [Planctomycetota bacterium]
MTVHGPLLRWTVTIVVVLLIPIVPLIGLGHAFEDQITDWVTETVSPPAFAGLLIGTLVADVFLPVPSSVVCTLAGARLGFWTGAGAAWLGMNLGSLGSFLLARWLGRKIVRRWTSADDLARMEELVHRRGALVIVLTRGLPVLSEAAVLLLGSMHLAWRTFLPAVLLSNLGLASAYALLGWLAYEEHQLPAAIAASIALPLLATWLMRQRWKASRVNQSLDA